MVRSFLICLSLLGCLVASAQTTDSVYGPLMDKVNGDSVLVFRKVDIQSAYPGGSGAWQRYLGKSLRYPEEAIKKNIQGTVVVQFIVLKDGTVTNVEVAKSVHPLLDKEAVRLIEKSADWTPAVQNGRQVNSYKKQPIVFKLQ